MPGRIQNLTPHTVHLMLGERMVAIPPSGAVARVRLRTKKMGYVTVGEQRVPLQRQQVERIEHLPPPEGGTWLIVSSLVALAAPRRSDLLVPRKMVRRDGRIVGCRALMQTPTAP